MKCVCLSFLLCLSTSLLVDGNPKIIIVGAGPSGIAAASRLLQNGIDDVIILEAEDRYGGRIKQTEIGEYITDLGAQWVHGEVGNVANELAAPLGLLSTPGRPEDTEPPAYETVFYDSSGTKLSGEAINSFAEFMRRVSEDISGLDELKPGSYGEYMRKRADEWFSKHPEVDSKLHQPLIHSLELVEMAVVGAARADDVSAQGIKDVTPAPGYRDQNWKERTYGTILEILMKKYPNPEEELPLLNKTLLNKKVTRVNYAGEGPVKVTTADGEEYTADHVIFTPSLGVLKADHEKIFEPPLPEKNRKAIQALGMGRSGKILLYYTNPWWESGKYWPFHLFLWTDDDRKAIENDPEKAWMLGMTYGFEVEWKPNLYQIWMSGPNLEQMETIPMNLLKNQTLEVIQRFFSKTYNLTEPDETQRTTWNTNANFRGSYSYPTIQSVTTKSGPAELGEPVMRGGIPVLCFAGEATEPKYYAMVHGAIASGWREADRLIGLYHEKPSDE